MGSVSHSAEEELDVLTDILKLSLQNSSNPDHLGVCRKCREEISGNRKGCSAMGNMYHVSCFTCDGCSQMLMGLEFFCFNNLPYCAKCFDKTLEKCAMCHEKITDRILKAVGKSYHTKCFICSTCHKKLDGVTFTIGISNAIHCLECYHLLFSPRCAVCSELILPTTETGETVHIIAMQKNFHVECYRCEVCDKTLSTRDGNFVDGHLLCGGCKHISWIDVSRKPNGRVVSTEL